MSANLNFLGSIDHWTQDDLAIVSEGALDKHTVVDPNGKSWLWKEPKSGREPMVWSELIASHLILTLLGWDAQRSSVAQKHQGYVCVMEYFYRPDETELVHGAEFLQELDAEYDLQKQTRHSWSRVETCFGLETLGTFDHQTHLNWWGQTFALDALICNADRHGHNWGILKDHRTGNSRGYAPRFDHNNCLGFMLTDTKLANLAANKQLEEQAAMYVERGRNHMRWEQPSKNKPLRRDFIRAFLTRYPNQRRSFEAVAELELGPMEDFLYSLHRIEEDFGPYRLTENRLHFVLLLLRTSQEQLKSILQGMTPQPL